MLDRSSKSNSAEGSINPDKQKEEQEEHIVEIFPIERTRQRIYLEHSSSTPFPDFYENMEGVFSQTGGADEFEHFFSRPGALTGEQDTTAHILPAMDERSPGIIVTDDGHLAINFGKAKPASIEDRREAYLQMLWSSNRESFAFIPDLQKDPNENHHLIFDKDVFSVEKMGYQYSIERRFEKLDV